MYPKNAASPEKVAIGAVVQISDGAVQTSGCTVRVITSNDAEADGGGTTAYSTDGVVIYTPTQVETNHASFILIAKKTGCIPACVTVVPTLSATAGQAVCADTQKVDVDTIKTQAVTCAAGVTVGAKVGAAEVILFTGTGASALVKADAVDLGGQAVSATKAVTTDVLTDGIKVSVGTATGQINVASGKVPATIAAGDIANNAITAAAIADAAIDNATFAADVGSTAYATNIIALAADKAIVQENLDHLFSAAYDPTSKPGNASGLLNVIVENDGGVPRFTANSLEQAPVTAGVTAADIADAVLDETAAGHTGLIAVALPNAAPGANGGLPTTNGTKVNQTVDLTAATIDLVWDEVLTSHRVRNSAADYVKKGGGGSTVTLFAGTAQAGATLTITLATDVPATANLLNQNLVVLTGGTGAGQTRRIVAYTAGRVCTVDRAWVVAPTGTSTYEVIAAASSIMADEGTVVAATSTTIQLATSAPTGDGALDGAMVTITSGNGNGETKILSNYVGSTRTADVDSAWSVTPNSSSTYAVIPTAQSAGDSGGGTTAPTIQEIQSALLKNTSNPILTDTNGYVTANVSGTVTVSGDVTLAATQPNYAPSKAGDAMALTSAYDAAKTAATQTSVNTIDTNVDTLVTNETTILARIGAFTGTGVNTILGFFQSLASKIATLPTDIGGTFDPATDSLESIREMEATILTAATSGGTGAGAITFVYTLTSTAAGNPPIADADVWVTTDLAGTNVVASGRTNQYGQITCFLDAGTVYVWRQKSGYDFTNPDIEIVS